jgi:gluconokinase
MTSNQMFNRGPPSEDEYVPLFIIGGPAGCGKSTIANAIASKTHFPFIEGDNLHPPQNVAKMSSGHPLVDADRWDWLDKLISRSQYLEQTESPKGIIITCSSLKKSYRDRLRKRVDEARAKGSKLREYFLFCNLSEEESLRRVQDRPGHYMKADMVASQFRDLEVPKEEEEERVFVLNVEKSIPEVNQEAIEFVQSCIIRGSDVKDTHEMVESST